MIGDTLTRGSPLGKRTGIHVVYQKEGSRRRVMVEVPREEVLAGFPHGIPSEVKRAFA